MNLPAPVSSDAAAEAKTINFALRLEHIPSPGARDVNASIKKWREDIPADVHVASDATPAPAEPTASAAEPTAADAAEPKSKLPSEAVAEAVDTADTADDGNRKRKRDASDHSDEAGR